MALRQPKAPPAPESALLSRETSTETSTETPTEASPGTPALEPLALPPALTLPALQAYVARMVQARNFTRQPERIYILLAEELGELATEFKHRSYYPEQFDLENLGFELADILLYLLDLGNVFGIDLMALWPEHEAENDRRFANRRRDNTPPLQIDPTLTLQGLVAHVEAKRRERAFEDTPERLMILLTEEAGEIATELRKRWAFADDAGNSGAPDTEKMGLEIIDALTYLFRLAGCFQVDLEERVTAKERLNATRTWEY